ncbi:redox-sensitive transcriptional activator SoxR [Bordetella genomosp. 1]|uniref:Redox-sensitive transcriptional activator SoxR n=1 Tax=Bordetella genomosp. 1 TaxID=1395607 RepID=A0A261SUT5_9BORD|nr:redox-sensitive transcriptional activator SoxR [Bordetella genomosp. 1]MDQ8032571.1 redox-sensitive transcriptional activator SoxR [Bordetella sp.]OZI41128.1 redox-sensitive transcriptional activator SoxR [Bordetella genomosp. 1]OZI69353.1 redox-sensitive transcriptional activator SoxR [Bordetella genomosp. 1]
MSDQEFIEGPLMAIGEIARRSGVAASALRFYESLGLITSVREGSSRRYFPRSCLRRIAFIVFAQRIGYSLEEIAEQVRTIDANKSPSQEDWKRMTRDWRARVRQRIEELERLDMELDHCIGCGCLSLKRCRLSNPDDRAGRAGPGARVWLGDTLPKGR